MGDRREMDKAPDAFRTISEVADELELPQHVLRFWETRFSQIKPVKRAGGRRFYRPEDVDLLRGIRYLLYSDGYTIKGVQKILKEHGIRHVQDLGVERDTALLVSGKQRRALSAALEDGTTFGGLLGLFPRRRGRDREDEEAYALPQEVELPLPFPDPELGADEGEGPVPSVPLRRDGGRREPSRRPEAAPPTARSAPPRQEPTFREPPHQEPARRERGRPEGAVRREPRMVEPERPASEPRPSRPAATPVREPLYAPTDDRSGEDPMAGPWAPPAKAARPGPGATPAARARQVQDNNGWEEDAYAPPPAAHRAPPQRSAGRPSSGARDPSDHPGTLARPTRGPAARIAPQSEMFDDPLLPFLDPEPMTGPSVSEALEDRIQRLKRGRTPPQSETVEDGLLDAEGFETNAFEAEPFEAEARVSRPATPGRGSGSPSAERRAAPRQQQANDVFAGLPAGEMPSEEASPWEASPWEDAPWEEDVPLPFEFPNEPGAERTFSGPHGAPSTTHREPGRNAPRAAAPALEPFPEEEQDFEAAPPRPSHPSARRPAASWPSEPEPHGAAHRTSAPQDGAYPVPMGERTGAPTGRVGPLSAPLEELDPDAVEFPVPVWPNEMPETTAPARAGALSQGTRVDSRRSPAPQGAAPWQQGAREMGGRVTPVWQDESMEGEGVIQPASQRMPREPFRPGPPEQYLPPHLRAEPRITGQPPVAAPVLSRDDLHRLRAALYELSECRRLMGDALPMVSGDEAHPG